MSTIRSTIYAMYANREHVTLASIHTQLQARYLFDGCSKSLYSLLKEIGFKWKKDEPRRGLMELPDVASKRIRFLREYNELKSKCLYQFVCLDETWIFQNGTVGRSWQDDNKKSVRSTKTDGKRYIVLHAGNENGYIVGAELIFASKSSGDYHGEMNAGNFLQWFKHQLLENLNEPSVIILDNVPYHNILVTKLTNTSWRKSQIQDWLSSRNIEFTQAMFKTELLFKVMQNKPPKVYAVVQLAEKYGHKVLRLPPYHCIFNPIELIWVITKNYYNRHMGRDGKTINNCLNMWREALCTITPDECKNSIQHTEREIQKWYEKERILDIQELSPIIIQSAEFFLKYSECV